MALVKFFDGRGVELSAEKGLAIWQVLNGQLEPTHEQEKFCEKVLKIYLNWRNAPDDYVLDRLPVLRSMYKATPQAAELEKRVQLCLRG